MTTPTPAPTPDQDLASPVDRALATAMRDAGWSWGMVPDDVAERHLTAIAALATEHAHAAARPPSQTWRSRMRRVAGLTIVKVAVGAGVAAAATTGGLAAGGHLPDPVQGAVADGIGWIGIDLPRPEPRPAPSSTSDSEPEVEDASRSTPPEDLPADDAPTEADPARAEVVPDDAPPATTPSPSGPPHGRSSAGPDDDAPAPPPEGGPQVGTDPGPDRDDQPHGPPDEDEPGTRETQGGADSDDAHERERRPASTAPRDTDEKGQAQSGQVPTSSSR